MTLLDLWIITNDSGIVVYRKVKDISTDDDCLGGFISAFIYYIKDRFHQPLERFSTSSFQFYLLKEHQISFMGKFPRQLKESIALRELVEFSDKFFAHFPRDFFDNWDSDVSKFAEFDYVIDSPSY